MRITEDRVDSILKALDYWLESDTLRTTIEKTVYERLFARHDIHYALDHLRGSVTKGSLTRWGKKAGTCDSKKSALCLHAGNLPLVGFQDIIAVLMAGYKYAGKISGKDPYLLPGFLEALKKFGFGIEIKYSLNLDDHQDLQSDAVLFSGSGDSVRQVKERISRLNVAGDEARYLIRTASFSMAYLDRDDDDSLSALAEAMLRYEGKGCRSVAMVVSPLDPDELIDRLGMYLETFWKKYPPQKVLLPKTKYIHAYNKALGKKQHLFRHLLIRRDGLEFDNDDVIYWIRGDRYRAGKLAKTNLIRLQNIYTVSTGITVSEFEDRIDQLSNAQSPPIDWKPDGVDALQWLVSESSE